MENNQRIKCDVKNCTYNDTEENLCNLNEIKVSSISEDEDSENETMCDNFEKE